MKENRTKTVQFSNSFLRNLQKSLQLSFKLSTYQDHLIWSPDIPTTAMCVFYNEPLELFTLGKWSDQRLSPLCCWEFYCVYWVYWGLTPALHCNTTMTLKTIVGCTVVLDSFSTFHLPLSMASYKPPGTSGPSKNRIHLQHYKIGPSTLHSNWPTALISQNSPTNSTLFHLVVQELRNKMPRPLQKQPVCGESFPSFENTRLNNFIVSLPIWKIMLFHHPLGQ